MRVGEYYEIENGKQSVKYLVIRENPLGVTLRRLSEPKSKADANKFPQTLTISKLP